MAKTSGQPFAFEHGLPSGFLYDTEPACRALIVARQLDERYMFDFLNRLQQAFYQFAQDITQPSLLRELAVQAGYDSEAFCAAFDAEETQATTQAEFAWVRNLAVSGFPTLLAQHQQQYALISNGYQPYAAFAALLNRWISNNAST